MHLHALYLKICRHVLGMALFFTISVRCTFLDQVFTCEMNLNSVLLTQFSSHRLNTRLRTQLPWVMEDFKEYFYLSAYFIDRRQQREYLCLRITVEYRNINGKSLFNSQVSRSVLVLVNSWSCKPSTIKRNLQFDGVTESPSMTIVIIY